MEHTKINIYDIEPHIAEIYDQSETDTDDIALIRNLIGTHRPLRILEPFCGTGRILIPLACDGHDMVGLDQAKGMLGRVRAKIAPLPETVRRRIALFEADVTTERWPQGFDLVILGGNCFYELATPQEQESCIASTALCLGPGGYVYVDNNHMEGELSESWQSPGIRSGAFPTGRCADGTLVESTSETIWFDAPRRLARFRRRTRVTLPDGGIIDQAFVQQKHPVSTAEVQTWLEAHGFLIERLYGDRTGAPYTAASPRAIFWARKKSSARPAPVLQATPYPEVNALLHALLGSVRAVLEDQFVGMYVHGSLACGDFEPGRSDVDFLVVTADELPAEMLAALAALHARLIASGMPWVNRLEGSYIPQRALRRYDPAHAQHPALRMDGTFAVDGHGIDWVILRDVIREQGIVLAGPDPRALIDPVPPDEIRRAALATLHEWWAPQLQDPFRLRSDEYRAYAVLTMCRALYTLCHATVVPKSTAAQWARAELGERWTALIDWALAWRHGVGEDNLDETLALIRYTLATAEEWNHR